MPTANTSEVTAILFSRSPWSQSSKTRIRKDCSFTDEFVTSLHTRLVLQSLDTLSSCEILTVDAYWLPELSKDEQDILKQQYPHINNFHQTGSSFSERFNQALTQTRDSKTKDDILLVGSDCPYINQDTLIETISALNKNEIVFGPDNKNGFYLVGIPSSVPLKSFNTVFEAEDQLQSFRELYSDKTIHKLKSLDDIDTSDDVIQLKSNALASERDHLRGFKELFIGQDYDAPQQQQQDCMQPPDKYQSEE